MPRLFLLFVLLSGCATAPPGPTRNVPDASVCAPSPERAARVTVSPEEDGTWLVEYAFAEPESALVFALSYGDYRRGTWEPLDDGVRIQREGEFDTVLLQPSSRTARFSVTPYTPVIEESWSPVLGFSDGGLAVHVGQFELVRVPDAAAAAALRDLDALDGGRLPFALALDTDATLVTAGDTFSGPACFESDDNGYVYWGPGTIAEGQSYVGIVDPGLPGWIGGTFDEDLHALFAALEENFGSPLPQRANILFAYGGAETEGIALKGSVLPGLSLAIQIEGSQLETPVEGVRPALLGFFAHESAHLFQFRDGDISSPENWIHEGHANAVAHRLVPEDGPRVEDEAESCRSALQSGTSLEAVLQAQAYECGPWVWSLADRLAPHDDLYSLWNRLVEASAGSPATSEHFLSVLRDAGAEGSEFDDLSRALRGDKSVDLVTLLDLEPVQE